MRSQTLAFLTLAALLFFPLGASNGPTDPETALVSPDGVALWDFTNGSSLWGRSFTFDPPDGVSESEILSYCNAEGTDSATTSWECLEQYIVDVRWSVPGTPGSAFHAVWDGVEFPNLASQNTVLASGSVSSMSAVVATMQTHDFVIEDNIDCCNNKNAEGYVYLWAFGTLGWDQTPKLECDDQSTDEGHCGVGAMAEFDLVSVGPNSCDGFLGQVEFWDEDSSNDDRMDISSKLGDAVANIQATTASQPSGAPCTSEAGKWWSERGNTDSPAANLCHEIDLNTVCELTGQHDTTGDNDDATLEFEIF